MTANGPDPLQQRIHVRDMDHVLLSDGRILSVHGYGHTPDHIIGELAFIPVMHDPQKQLLGRGYRKAYTENGRGLPERSRIRIRDDDGASLPCGPLYETKSITTRSRIDTYLPARPILHIVDEAPRPIARDLIGLKRQLSAYMPKSVADRALITGSLNLIRWDACQTGLEYNFHDIDVVFEEPPEVTREIVRNLATKTQIDPATRIREHGKYWRMRLRTPFGILCPFFREQNPEESFEQSIRESSIVASNVDITGTIVGEEANSYNPTVLQLLPDRAAYSPPGHEGHITIAILHLRSRGEFFIGDRGRFSGSLLHLRTATGWIYAIAVVDGDSSLLLSPPWGDFYNMRSRLGEAR